MEPGMLDAPPAGHVWVSVVGDLHVAHLAALDLNGVAVGTILPRTVCEEMVAFQVSGDTSGLDVCPECIEGWE